MPQRWVPDRIRSEAATTHCGLVIDGVALHRILVAFDGTTHAQTALAHAVVLAEATNGRLTVMIVVPAASPWVSVAWEVPIALAGADGDTDAAYQAILDRGMDDVPADLPVVKLVRRGPVADEIL